MYAHIGHTQISIHAPREGGDTPCGISPVIDFIFQSTPPARGATQVILGYPAKYPKNFNPRPPRGGRPALLLVFSSMWPTFQSTPPARGATTTDEPYSWDSQFQSTPPARGATAFNQFPYSNFHISIHAPREGGDFTSIQRKNFVRDFNPRPPRGGRPDGVCPLFMSVIFQSTPPARGATSAPPCR